jgi:DNA-binding SARP family transcriptional activator
MRILRSFFRVIVAAALVAVTALLLASPPALPTTAAVSSVRRVDEILIFIAWLGCLLLAVGLLYRVATRTRPASPRFTPIRNLHPARQATPVAASPYPDRAFPLTLKRPRASPERARDESGSKPEHASPTPDGEAAPERAKAGATISLLGPLTISGGRKNIRRLRGPTKELLAYLALHPSGVHRDQIIDALWPDHASEQGRQRLWRAAGDARAHFGDSILLRDGEHYRLERTAIAIDLDQLDRLRATLQQLEQADDQLPLLEQALALFQGEPLAGSDFPWAENEQRRLHAVQLDLLERAGRARLVLGDAAGALASAEVGLANEPYNEQLARLAMRAEAALGLRSAIISRYENLTQLLDAQLGLQPHQDTRRLYRQLLSQDHRHEPAVS